MYPKINTLPLNDTTIKLVLENVKPRELAKVSLCAYRKLRLLTGQMSRKIFWWDGSKSLFRTGLYSGIGREYKMLEPKQG